MVSLNIELPKGFLDEENRNGYIVSKTMKEIWAVELDILNKIQEVCNKYNIQILAAGGTMLGAVRHNGMIPWDDDIDLKITRENYEKLCAVAESEFSYPYFFQTEYTDRGCMRGHAQVRRSDTAAILLYEMSYATFNQGIFVDIFPFDNIPDNNKKREKLIRQVKLCKKIASKINWYSNYKKIECAKDRIVIKKIIFPFAKILHLCNIDTLLYNLMELTAEKYNGVETLLKGSISFNPDDIGFWCESKSFKSTLTLPFEFLRIDVPENYHEDLKRQYGDYTQFVIGSNFHGKVLFDTNRSYEQILDRKN